MGVASPFFRELPLEQYGLHWIRPPAAVAHPFDDGSAAVLSRSLERTGATLGADAERWARMMAPFLARSDQLFREVLQPVRVPRRPLLMARFGWLGLQRCTRLAARFETPHARGLFAGCAAHSFLPLDAPASASFGLVLALAGHAMDWPVARGGSQRIVDALAAHLRSLGGSIECGRRVRSLRDLPDSRAVLFDVHPRGLESIAGDALPARYRQKLNAYRHGPGAFKVDWALRGPIPWKASACRDAATVHLGNSLEEIAAWEGAAARGKIGERPFVLVAQPSLFDDCRAPAGVHAGWAYCHVPFGSDVDMTDRIEQQVERFAPGFRDLIVARHTMTPADIEGRNSNMVGGDISGGANDLGQLLFRPIPQWDPYRTPNPRLFLCSSSTPPGGGVHGMCGYWAARAALRRLGRATSSPQ
jgi:phytoene dehydrogenase-like protein